MIVRSLVRGLEGSVKKRNVRELIMDLNLDFFSIQKVKLIMVEDFLYRYLWGDSYCGWISPVVGERERFLSSAVLRGMGSSYFQAHVI